MREVVSGVGFQESVGVGPDGAKVSPLLATLSRLRLTELLSRLRWSSKGSRSRVGFKCLRMEGRAPSRPWALGFSRNMEEIVRTRVVWLFVAMLSTDGACTRSPPSRGNETAPRQDLAVCLYSNEVAIADASSKKNYYLPRNPPYEDGVEVLQVDNSHEAVRFRVRGVADLGDGVLQGRLISDESDTTRLHSEPISAIRLPGDLFTNRIAETDKTAEPSSQRSQVQH